MKRVNISIREDQDEYLKNHPEINLSGLVRASLDRIIKGSGNTPAVVPVQAITPAGPGDKVPVECDKCGFKWEYGGSRNRIQCINCGHRITINRN